MPLNPNAAEYASRLQVVRAAIDDAERVGAFSALASLQVARSVLESLIEDAAAYPADAVVRDRRTICDLAGARADDVDESG